MAIVLSPEGNEIDLDAEIDLDEVASPSGVSLIGIDDDEFPTDRPQPQPSIDQIENAWESPDAWEPQDPISDADVFGDHDDDEFNVIDDQPPTQTVPLANDDQSFFERHHWGRRQRNSIRLLKIASPTLIAVPIIAVILYASGANALFDLLGQSTDPIAAREHSDTDQTADPIPPADADADLVSSDGPSTETTTPDLATPDLATPDLATNRTDVEVKDVDEVIQSIKRTGEAIAEERSTTAEEPSALTIAMRAKQQWKERHRQPQPDAAEQQRALLDGATLTFPHEPPSADSVLQTSAQSDIDAEPIAPEPIAPEPIAPEPIAPEPIAPEPIAPEPIAPEPIAPEPIAPEPIAPEPITPEPITPEPITPEPITPEPITPEPIT
ncbi:hypothetical protein CKO51_31285, partial [Rhodopirellula sp. SM50]